MKTLNSLCALLLITFSFALKNNPTFDWKKGDSNTQNIEVKLNKSFSLRFLGNPTAGFSWTLADVNNLKNRKPQVIKPTNLINEDKAPFVPKTSILGSEAYFIFTFDGVNTGVATINLIYKRPWEDRSDNDIVVTFNLTVK